MKGDAVYCLAHPVQEINRSGNKFQWPPLDDVIDYRHRVRRLICDFIDRCDIQLPVTIDSQLVSFRLSRVIF